MATDYGPPASKSFSVCKCADCYFGDTTPVWCLRNSYTFAAMDFGRRPGASDEHIPQWICKEQATTPPPKRHAALRVALKFAWGFVAHSVEYRWGYTPSFAPRPRPI